MAEEPMPSETAYQLVHDELEVSRIVSQCESSRTFCTHRIVYVPALLHTTARRDPRPQPGLVCDHLHGLGRRKADDGEHEQERHRLRRIPCYGRPAEPMR